MKKALMILLCGTLLIVGSFKISSLIDAKVENVVLQKQPRPTVVIDPGHGGVDVGAVGCDSSYEKNINLEIALDLYDYLMVSGINAVLTRSGDYELYKSNEQRNKSDLYNRFDFINSFDNAHLISIHQNHYENQTEWGSQVWYSVNDDKSKILADGIQESIKDYIQPNNSRINKASDDSYYLLYKAQVPSVMVECGFISNAEENKKLQNSQYQSDMAFAILTGICEEV